jgi:thymidylate kinase
MTVAQRPHDQHRPSAPATPGLVRRLGDALAARNVPYCQWKGSRRPERWLTGAGDIDLLVDRTAQPLFAQVLGALGFKRVEASPWSSLPGTETYFGYDPDLTRLVNVHVHYRIVFGRPWTMTYAPPVEAAVLAGASRRFVFRAPAPEHELVLLVLRLALQCTARDTLLRPHPPWLMAAQTTLQQLEREAPRSELVQFLTAQFPSVDVALFDRCRRALESDRPAWTRYVAGRALRARLAPFARRPRPVALLMALAHRLGRLVGYHRRLGARLPRGSVVGLLGGDGAGKSTCARALTAWLAPDLATMHAHLGRPPRSAPTYVVGAALKASRGVGWAGVTAYVDLLRHICTARDRYRLYRKTHRFAAAGGIVIAERYPIPANYFLAGPSAAQGLGTPVDNRMTRLLRRREALYYKRMSPPDTAIVLQLDPETAVRRKPEEPSEYVRGRAQVVWQTDWAQVGAHVIDAGRALPEVVRDLKSHIWGRL